MTLGTFEVEAGGDVNGLVDDRRDVRLLVLEAGLGFLLVFGVDGVDVPSAAYSKRFEGLGTSGQDEGCRPGSESFMVPGPGGVFSVVLPSGAGWLFALKCRAGFPMSPPWGSERVYRPLSPVKRVSQTCYIALTGESNTAFNILLA